MPHRQIPVQLQSEVRKCLDNWLKQGIIRLSKSPCASQVVIVRKKTGEIRLCVDFRKLNAISIRDSFPLPRVEEALQAVQAAVWFSSFDLAQGYLQMAMEEEDIEKTAFRAGSSGLYEFTLMPFGLTNAGASFCRLMEMCIGDQQYVTLLFYLDDICIFAETADQMLDRIEFVFSRLKEFNLKIKPKQALLFWGIFYRPTAYRQTRKRLQKSRIGLLLKHQRRFIHSLGLLRITVDSSLTSLNGLDHSMP